VISPPPAILVDQTFTFIINCTAMGVPTPEVVWRLNWGHVPDKCRMTNTVQEGNRAFGELTCPNAVLSDSGRPDPLFACEMSSSKKLTCKGTLRQVFIRVYSLEIHSKVGIFDPALPL
jgi:hypothetical protein